MYDGRHMNKGNIPEKKKFKNAFPRRQNVFLSEAHLNVKATNRLLFKVNIFGSFSATKEKHVYSLIIKIF